MAVARGIAVILCICAVGYDEHLHKLKQTAFSPKTVALVAVDLIERFPYCHTAAFEFDMNERETVYKHGNVVAVFVSADVVLVLVDDLQPVGVYIRFVDKRNIFCQPVISLEIDTAVAFLQFPRFSTMLSLAFAICTEKNRFHSESVNCMPFKASNCLRKLIIKSASV